MKNRLLKNVFGHVKSDWTSKHFIGHVQVVWTREGAIWRVIWTWAKNQTRIPIFVLGIAHAGICGVAPVYVIKYLIIFIN